MKRLNIKIQTHGCKLNIADSQGIAKSFHTAGHSISSNEVNGVDVFILNSCTVTHVADSKARQAIRRARRSNPEALIVMTGCYAERDKKNIESINEVDLVIDNKEKKYLVGKVLDKLDIQITEKIKPIGGYPLIGRSRASIKIQEGCDQVCSYCIIPTVRGRERSVDPTNLISQINELSINGIKEVVLTGTQLGNYGFDLNGINLSKLLVKILNETDVPRIRVSSLQPKEIDNEIIDIWTNEGLGRICPHFHVPLQSGSDKILKEMRRRYTSSEYLDVISNIKKLIPECSITSDVIVGFPEESDSDFLETISTIEKAKLSDVHVFPYSKRPGTTAFYNKNQIHSSVIKDRTKELLNLVHRLSGIAKQSLIGKERSILWEGQSKTSGLTEDYFKVTRKTSKVPGNEISNEKIKGLENNKVIV
ncbi:MAG: tRNA (N(6)-L-threonylcarbamoyladenosine(37)-C(2))-methylthiotransferase MtaB [Chloroflexi bacterium]|nr:tRNA (N(6)-L-threonylcarbamoyladenosine(37)-C(2))-methylthiotransferase MtaB [Chloroflexota bacterium]|tara:strand:+ start:4620 stop:5882 length:1263 start_codon:yes stop_codon:yes gene_type:complete